MTGGTTKNIVLFDGICNLCNGLIQFIIKRDRTDQFRFATLQSEIGRQLLQSFDLTPTGMDSFVFIKKGKYLLKSTAALNLLKELGGFWKLFYLFIIIPRPIRDGVYSLIAKSRYKIFGKRNSCMIPTPGLRKKFL